MGIIIAILLFSFIVIFHEMGHFLIAKANGIEVEEFALGMGPLLFSKEYKGTRYCLRLLPIGGACMMGEDVTYEHDGEKHTVTLTPKYDEENQYYRLGISRGANEKAGFFKSLQYGTYEVKYWICTTVSSLKMLIMRQVGIDQMSGPVGIVGAVDETYQASSQYGVLTVIASMLNIAILLSANLGVMNLLPIPALDGGRLVFLFVEAIRRKKIPPEKEGYVHLIGFALLMALMVVVLFNDIRKLIM